MRERGLAPQDMSPKVVLRAGRPDRERPSWRDAPATDRQRQALTGIIDRRRMPAELLDEPLTAGQADTAITAALDGQTPGLTYPSSEAAAAQVQARSLEETAPQPPADQGVSPETGDEDAPAVRPAPTEEQRRAVIDAVTARVSADEALNAAAATEANSREQYQVWAAPHAKTIALASLADLMEDGDAAAELRPAARALLADEALWGQIPQEAAEKVWQTHRGAPSEVETAAGELAGQIAEASAAPGDRAEQQLTVIPPAPDKLQELHRRASVNARTSAERGDAEDFDYWQGRAAEYLDQINAAPASEQVRQQVIQAALEQATTVESINWAAVGASRFDPQQPTERSDPYTDPVLVRALVGVPKDSPIAGQARVEYSTGYGRARDEYLAPEYQRLYAQVGNDPAIIEAARTLGLGAKGLGATPTFTGPALEMIRTTPAESDRQAAAIRMILLFSHGHVEKIAEQAIAQVEAEVVSPFRSPAEAGQWRDWAAAQLESDPFLASWQGLPMNWPRLNALEQAVDRIVGEFEQQRPDLAAAMTSVDTAWLATDMHRNVHPSLTRPDPLADRSGGWLMEGSNWKLDQPGRKDPIKVGQWHNESWVLSTDGGDSEISYGSDYQAAQGAAERIAGIESTPQVRQAAEAVEATRTALAQRARVLLADDELVLAVARSETLMREPLNAQWSAITSDAVRHALAQITAETPELADALARHGLDAHRVTKEAVLPSLLPELRDAQANPDLFTAAAPTDLHANHDGLIVGDPEGEHVEFRPAGDQGARRWVSEQAVIFADTAAEALARARAHLGATPAVEVGEPQAERAAAAELPAQVAADDLHLDHETGRLTVGDPAGRHVVFERSINPDGTELWASREALVFTATAADAAARGRRYLADQAQADARAAAAPVVPNALPPAERAVIDAAADADYDPATGRLTITAPTGQTVQFRRTGEARTARWVSDEAVIFTESAAGAIARGRAELGIDPPAPAEPAEVAAEPATSGLPRVPQDEPGLPVTLWGKHAGELVEVQRPDGSTVRITRETLAGYENALTVATTPDGGVVHISDDGRRTWVDGPTEQARESAREAEAKFHAAEDAAELAEARFAEEDKRAEPLAPPVEPVLNIDTTMTPAPPPRATPVLNMGPDAPAPAPTTEPTAAAVPVLNMAAAEPEPDTIPTPAGPAPEAAGDFRLGTEVLVPSGVRERITANVAAIALVKQLDAENRGASADEQQVLARWSGWGGAWQVFDTTKTAYSTERAELRTLLDDDEYAQAARSTINAHYTDPAIVSAMWDALEEAGLPAGARVLEPGAGAGHFFGHAPESARMVGVELDAMTAKIAHRLYPNQQVRNHGFERDFAPDGSFTAAIGNVPFGDVQLYDPRHNPNATSIHNHFIRKSLALTAPGGYVAVITSRFTADAARTGAKADMAALGDLVAGVRLPSKAFDRQAKTDVVTDLLVFRRREEDREQSEQTRQWVGASERVIGGEKVWVNDWLHAHPENVLGTMRVSHGLHGASSLNVDADTSRPLADQLAERLSAQIEAAKAQGLALSAPGPAPEPDLDRAGLVTAADLAARPMPGALRFNEVTARFEQYGLGTGWGETTKKGKARTAEWNALLQMGDTVMALIEAGRTDTTAEHRAQLRERLGGQYDAYVAKYGPINRYKWTNHATRLTDEQATIKFPEVEKKWRETNGEPLYDADGEPLTKNGKLVREPVVGELPDEVVAELWEQAYTPAQGPYKKRTQFEGAIKNDPRLALVRGIEHYNDDTHEARKAAVFTADITSRVERITHTDNVDEAIAVAFDESGTITPHRIAELLGTNVPDALRQAEGKIFPDLESDHEYVAAAKFLSGNVRAKLAAARVRAEEDPARYAGAVAALAKAVPAEVDPSKISLRPGAAWIGLDTYKQFLAEEFEIAPGRITVDYSEQSGSWKIDVSQDPNWANPERGYRDNWGLPSANMPGVNLFETMCNNKAVMAWKSQEELDAAPKPAFHKGRTEELRDRAERLEERFGQWLWSDPERTDRLTRIFNEQFNSFVRLEYGTEHKTFPGMNPAITPYEYQKQAAVRLLNDETVLLDHCVGAGKTWTVAMSCMEMKRLGQVQQPWIVVPNHLIDQWHREVMELYPGANVLVAANLEDKADRQRFMGQSAAGDWDLVIVPESKFKLMGVSDDTKLAYLRSELATLESGLTAAKEAGSGHSVKEIQKAIVRQEEKLKKLIGEKQSDPGLTFEQTGCDFLYVDEAHMYKNLARPSKSSDLSVVAGAERATDMEMKINLLRQRAVERNRAEGRPNAPAKAVAFATGTPVSNSMSELWVMQKYLRPDLLDDMGMGHIDAWAQSFARQRTSVEMNVTGTQLRAVPRMAEYTNLPQMIAMVDQFRDVVTRDQIPSSIPTLRGGGRKIIEFELGADVRDFMHDLDQRMMMTTGDTAFIDNALKIGNDGRNASLHPRLANLAGPEPENDRLEHIAEQVWRVHDENRHVRTPADKHGPEAEGVFQVIFCDRGTPKPGVPAKDSLYGGIKAKLVARGMDPSEIAFIHDYPSPRQKQQLFADCRSGKIRVLIGSTEKMSTGMNVQRLLKALHHADCPYRPADLEQREGRILRQGNVHSEVEILNYVAAKSFDATMWQIVERKARYIQQLKTGDLPQTIEDIGGDMALSAAQTKAAATGDPIYVQAVEKEAEVKRLVNEQNAVEQINRQNEYALRMLTAELPILRAQAEELAVSATALAQWSAAERDTRKITIGDVTVTDADAPAVTEAVKKMLGDRFVYMQLNRSTEPQKLLEIAGVPFYGTYHPQTGAMAVHTDSGITRVLTTAEVAEAMTSNTAAQGFITRVRNMAKAAEGSASHAAENVEDLTRRLAALQADPPLTFDKTDQLRQAQVELVEMNADINARENSPAAIAQRAREHERRSADGQYKRWTLDLNPTQGHAAASRMTRKQLALSVAERMREAAQKWRDSAAERAERRARNPWQAVSSDGSQHLLGAPRDAGKPGAEVTWTDRNWHWVAYDGKGETRSGVSETRDGARSQAQDNAAELARDIGADTTPLFVRQPVENTTENTTETPAAEDSGNITVLDSPTQPESADPGISPEMLDAFKAIAEAHPHDLRDMLGNDTGGDDTAPDAEDEGRDRGHGYGD